MSGKKIALVVVAPGEQARQELSAVLRAREGLRVLEAPGAAAACELWRSGAVDLILVELGEEGEGMALAEEIALACPQALLVLTSLSGDAGYLQEAMALGIRDYILTPAAVPDLAARLARLLTIEARRRQGVGKESTPPRGGPATSVPGKVLTVFSAKGGVGKTTLATNLACALARLGRKRVVLWDLDLQFGDVGVMVDIAGKRTLADLAQERGEIDRELVESYLLPVPAAPGVKVLLAPARPEEAELVGAALVEKVLAHLRELADLVMVDTAQSFQDQILAVLDHSDRILLVTALDLPTLKNVKLCLGVMESLNYARERIKVIVNRSAADVGLKVSQLETALQFPLSVHIPSDGRLAIAAANAGVPFIISHPRAKISRAIEKLAEDLLAELAPGEREREAGKGRAHFFPFWKK